MYAFTSNLNNPYGKADKLFEAFVNFGGEATQGAKGFSDHVVADAFEKIGDKMLYLFDYGDEWQFILKLESIQETEKTTKNKLILLKSTGEDPKQHPDYEE